VRIALVCPYDWVAPGGVQVHVRELGERLRSRGHDVIAIAPSSARPPEDWARPVGRPIRVRYGGTTAPIAPWPSTRRRVRTEIARFRPEVVHVHEPFAPSATLFALSAGPPVVATFHSGLDHAVLYDLASPVLRRVARRITARIAVSEHAASVARRRLGGNFEVVPNGIDVERFAGARPATLPGEGAKVLFVGRLHPRKGFPVLVDAFERLSAVHPDLRLVVVGEGADAQAVERLAPPMRERVSMLGAIANEELPTIHAACDVFVAPNTGRESFGVVLVEAMAARLPVVASRIAGFVEVVRDGVDGLLVRPGDPGSLAEAIDRILRDPVLAKRFAAAGRAHADVFSWEAVVPRVEAVYETARVRGVR
jgi:phosphatidylinositol alpha-mannosyltransferase